MLTISSDLVSAMDPFNISGSTATVVVSSGGKLSNTVTVPVTASSPGLFTATSNGLGSAAILHPDYKLVSTSNPARRGETVQIYLTGLGPVRPSITAGTAAPPNPMSLVTGPFAVSIHRQPATTRTPRPAPPAL